MNDILRPGAGVIFMKVGVHANEPLEEIIGRKQKEIEAEGFALWGYGGNTCHPRSMVQPFAQEFAAKEQPIHLVMHEMKSNHFALPARAVRYSADDINWEIIPDGINCVGSRFALKIKELSQTDLLLPLASTYVPVGPNKGRRGTNYIKGQADKACLVVTDEEPDADERKDLKIGLIAELVEPYAVFLEN